MASDRLLRWRSNGDGLEVTASGPWTCANAAEIEQLIDRLSGEEHRPSVIDTRGIQDLDTYGAWLLERLTRGPGETAQAQLAGVPERFRGLVDKIHRVNRREPARPTRQPLELITDVGRRIETTSITFLGTFGAIATAFGRVALRPHTLRLTSLVHHLDRVGWQAVPIIVLITFLVGCIIAQQAIFHFRQFGAEDYVVDLVGILVLRELGVLIVAIMVAGRSGSSYTAELGSMKMREEIDALRTMGRDPVEILILPRVLAIVCALPMLALLGSLAALFGGGLVARLYGGMEPAMYLARLREAISVTHFEVGMIKAPFMALVIGAVAASEGLQVEGSAESLGWHTTRSVVQAIFLVIVLDGLFAMFFASIGM
jgi:phospholipid/cholesterol/gamma-HCH transport system permease protein